MIISQKGSIRMIVCLCIFCTSFVYGSSFDIKSNETLPENSKVSEKYKDELKIFAASACLRGNDYGELKIQFIPNGAEICIDGEPVVYRGNELSKVILIGQHTIVVKHPEYEQYSQNIDIRVRELCKITCKLIKKGGTNSKN